MLLFYLFIFFHSMVTSSSHSSNHRGCQFFSVTCSSATQEAWGLFYKGANYSKLIAFLIDFNVILKFSPSDFLMPSSSESSMSVVAPNSLQFHLLFPINTFTKGLRARNRKRINVKEEGEFSIFHSSPFL